MFFCNLNRKSNQHFNDKTQTSISVLVPLHQVSIQGIILKMVKATTLPPKQQLLFFFFCGTFLTEFWFPVQGLRRDYQCFTPGECKNRSGLVRLSLCSIFFITSYNDELVSLRLFIRGV